ncbi:hypothetical protein AVENLUH5627_02569 [Acinetobacter venetianus]|uniref:DUF3570 domain-containing protein n=1 Tax=Acinetobacter venetianus TaxID=52133 RepID=A0A150HLR0_9GAMM|nr:DUF3570 domain-containing protein [Acinetobacter venetianus]KXZ66558.1 hypothetical protein AVENLUH5627_02569 [Acinetobacter venetianus]
MQLTKKSARHIALALTQASTVLLSSHVAHAETTTTSSKESTTSPFSLSKIVEPGWKVDTAVLMYKEADSRVQAIEPSVRFEKDFGDQHILSGKVVVDSLTGASPNGATSANVPQTFTGPSGNAAKPTPANQLPLDDEFHDTRVAASANWQQPIAPDMKLNVGGNVSNEYDFRSIGANASIAKDFNDKNTTVSLGGAFEYDSIDAVGGAPVPLTPQLDGQKQQGTKSKNVSDVLLGLTQVIDRHSLVQLNYSLSMSNGYQNDPYKILTLVDANGNLIADQDFAAGNNFYLFENRPEKRTRHSFFGEYKYGFDRGDVADVSYRFTTDDWGVKSHTFDAKYRYAVNEKYFIEPHVRYYTQTAADFYHSYLKVGDGIELDAQGEPVPTVQYASADSRLGAFDATTYGVKFGMNLANDRELSFRVEQYDQKAKDLKPIGGNLAGQILQPDLSATFVQLGYSFKW